MILPVRIVYLINGLRSGGAETMLYKVLRATDPESFSSSVVTLIDGGKLRPRIEALGVPVDSLGMTRGVPGPVGFLRLLRLLRDRRPHVIHTWLYQSSLVGLIAGRIQGVPACVWNLRNSDIDWERYPTGSRMVFRTLPLLSELPDAVVVNSNSGKIAHEQASFRPRRWEVIPNGFDVDEFRPNPAARLRFRAPLDFPRFVIGLVARWDPMKDHRTFLEAAARFRNLKPDTRFVLVGQGMDARNPALANEIAKVGLGESVELLGERTDMPEIVPGFDVLSLTSAFGEGFPNAVGEAMACEVPSVVTAVGDAAPVVGDTGIVVPAGEPDAHVRAWTELYEMDPERRRAIGHAARERVERLYSIEGIADSYAALHTELAEAG